MTQSSRTAPSTPRLSEYARKFTFPAGRIVRTGKMGYSAAQGNARTCKTIMDRLNLRRCEPQAIHAGVHLQPDLWPAMTCLQPRKLLGTVHNHGKPLMFAQTQIRCLMNALQQQHRLGQPGVPQCDGLFQTGNGKVVGLAGQSLRDPLNTVAVAIGLDHGQHPGVLAHRLHHTSVVAAQGGSVQLDPGVGGVVGRHG